MPVEPLRVVTSAWNQTWCETPLNGVVWVPGGVG